MPRVLSESLCLRLAALSLPYASMGLTSGMLSIGLRPYMLSLGVSTAACGQLAAFYNLPWTFKMAVASAMDTIICRRYGFRRPWVILGQFGLVLSMITFSLGRCPTVAYCLRLFT